MTTTKTTPVLSELTVPEAAKWLCVSEPFLIQKLDSGEIPYQFSEGERRIFLKDLLTYMETKKELRLSVLSELTAESQEAGLY